MRILVISMVFLGTLTASAATAETLPSAVGAEAARLGSLLDDAARGHRAAAEFGLADCLDRGRLTALALGRMMENRGPELTAQLVGGDAAAREFAANLIGVALRQVGEIAAEAAACYEIPEEDRPRGYVSVKTFERSGGVLLVAYPAQFDEPDSTGPPLLDRRPDWLDHYRGVVRRF